MVFNFSQGAVSEDEHAPVYTWLMRFAAESTFDKMQHAVATALFEGKWGAGAWNKLKEDERDYQRSAYVEDTEMYGIDEEGEDDEEAALEEEEAEIAEQEESEEEEVVESGASGTSSLKYHIADLLHSTQMKMNGPNSTRRRRGPRTRNWLLATRMTCEHSSLLHPTRQADPSPSTGPSWFRVT